MNSLISKDLLIQHNWIGQGSPKKYSFEKMRQIQSVLWCAMLRISSTYSIKDFEEDLKANLIKCVTQMKSQKKGNETEAIESSLSQLDEFEEISILSYLETNKEHKTNE